jgi:EmrB/QacA subfamily drug resistance transporter
MPTVERRIRIVPLVVAAPMFLQNLDTSVMATALPAMARSLQTDVLHLNLAITSYLVSLVLFLPASGWLADRFGARRVFCAAVLLFSAASALCGAAGSLAQLVLFRLLQGAGGAMMVPVGRLILLRTIPAELMVAAMVWFTVPGGVGRLMGPLFGGAIVTAASWRWIFLVNIPFGLAAVVLALRYIEADLHADRAATPLDVVGLALLAAALGGLLGALEMVGKGLLPWPGIAAVAVLGVAALLVYLRRGRGQAHSLIDFSILRFRSYRASVLGGLPLRVAIGATPFLLPLLFQLGFGMSPLRSGLLTVATAVGSLSTRGAVTHAVRRLGYRPLLVVCGVCTSVFYALYGFFTPATPPALIAGVLLLAGTSNAMSLVILATVGYREIPRDRMAHATALASMGQALSVTLGVAVAASLVELAHYLHGAGAAGLAAADFAPAFRAIAVLPLVSAFAFWRLPKTAALGSAGGG